MKINIKLFKLNKGERREKRKKGRGVNIIILHATKFIIAWYFFFFLFPFVLCFIWVLNRREKGIIQDK